MAKQYESKTIALKGVRLAYPALVEPEDFNGDGNFAWKALVLLPKGSAQAKEVRDIVASMAKEQLGRALPEDKTCLADGDTAADESQEGKAEYKRGHLVLSCRNAKSGNMDNAPGAFVKGQEAVTNDDLPSGGIYNVRVQFWIMDNQYGKRVNCRILAANFIKPGEPIGSTINKSLDDDLMEGIGEDDL